MKKAKAKAPAQGLYWVICCLKSGNFLYDNKKRPEWGKDAKKAKLFRGVFELEQMAKHLELSEYMPPRFGDYIRLKAEVTRKGKIKVNKKHYTLYPSEVRDDDMDYEKMLVQVIEGMMEGIDTDRTPFIDWLEQSLPEVHIWWESREQTQKKRKDELVESALSKLTKEEIKALELNDDEE